MKKLLIVPLLLVLTAAAAAENRFFLAAGANFVRPADESYREIYGNQAIFPDLSVAVRLVGGLCLTGSLGKFTRTGLTAEIGSEARASQGFYAAGLGYLLRVSELVCLEAGGGVAWMNFREDALGLSIEGSRMGYLAEGGILIVPEDDRIFMGVKAGYLSARVDDLDAGLAGLQSVKLGGLRFTVSVGIQLFGGD